jgi:hypothetical protein
MAENSLRVGDRGFGHGNDLWRNYREVLIERNAGGAA